VAPSLKDSNQPVIIIKKRKKVAHAHHGGAWKVAYADFVTAMMAFFLLLWLLAVTTSEQRQGIADYFTPASVSRQTSGSGGVLGGITITVPGAQVSPSSPIAIEEIPSQGRPGFASEAADDAEEPTAPTGGAQGTLAGLGREGNADGTGLAGNEQGIGREGDQGGRGVRFMSRPPDGQAPPPDATGGNATLDPQTLALLEADPEALARLAAEGQAVLDAVARAAREQAQFDRAEAQLRQAIQQIPDLQQVQQNLVIDQTPEGLRIQIVDREGYSMFPSGSANLLPQTRRLLQLVAQAVQGLPNRLAISGHTDSTPFPRGNYDNWDLSADRANASRRALLEAGLQGARIAEVVGRADTDHIFPDEPNSPRNRRISIVLLREGQQTAQAPPTQPQVRAN
jgi:chemotaxis protein MotB